MPLTRTVPALLTAAIALAGSPPALAQQPAPADLERMMEQARQMQMQMPDPSQLQTLQAEAMAMQECLQGIDPGALQAMQREGEAVGREIRALCADGRRDAAQDRAMDYAARVGESDEMRRVRECARGMDGMLSALSVIGSGESAGKDGHICDSASLP